VSRSRCSSIEPLLGHMAVSTRIGILRLLKLVRRIAGWDLGGAHILSPVAQSKQQCEPHGLFRLWYPERLRRLSPQINVVLSQSRAEWIITIETELIIRVVQHDWCGSPSSNSQISEKQGMMALAFQFKKCAFFGWSINAKVFWIFSSCHAAV
jgi:hypothetical protein